MAFFETYRHTNGNYSTYSFTLKEWIQMKITTFMLMVAFWLLMAACIPALFFLIYFIQPDKHRPSTNLVAIIASVAYLLDYHFGGLFYLMFGDLIRNEGLTLIAVINATLLVVHLYLLFGARRLYIYLLNRASRKGEPNAKNTSLLTALGLSFLFIYYGFKLFNLLLPHMLHGKGVDYVFP